MGKKTTTLYLDEDLVHRCKELSINISNTTEKILKIVLEKQPLNEEEIRLSILLGERSRLINELQKHKGMVKTLQGRVTHYDSLIKKQQELVEEIKRSNEIARLMRILNAKIRSAEYDLAKIKVEAAETLKQLAIYHLPTDDSWLLKQIERVKRLKTSF